MARATVFRLRGTPDPIEAGRGLGVGAVLTGTVVPVCIARAPGAPLEAPPGVAKPRSGKEAVNV